MTKKIISDSDVGTLARFMAAEGFEDGAAVPDTEVLNLAQRAGGSRVQRGTIQRFIRNGWLVSKGDGRIRATDVGKALVLARVSK